MLVGLLIGCLVGCLVICFHWLVGRSVLVDWLILVHSGACGAGWLLAWPQRLRLFHACFGFTKHKSSTDHKGWQLGCKWTSQICNVVHCLGALDCDQCTYTYDISQILRKVICFHSWIDILLIFSALLVWQFVGKNSLNFCPWVYIHISKPTRENITSSDFIPRASLPGRKHRVWCLNLRHITHDTESTFTRRPFPLNDQILTSD